MEPKPELQPLPEKGLINIVDLAKYMGTNPYTCRKNLVKRGIPIIVMGYFLREKFVRLEDLGKKKN
jgi:hypothetical protein